MTRSIPVFTENPWALWQIVVRLLQPALRSIRLLDEKHARPILAKIIDGGLANDL